MSKISLRNNFKVCPEGRHIFKITRVDYDVDFGKLLVFMENAQGDKHVEKFSLLQNSGEPNSKAYSAFAFFAKTALGNADLEEIEHTDLVGHYIGGEITHTVLPNRNDPSKTVTFANIGEKWVAEGFDGVPSQLVQTEGVDLNSLLD